MAGIKTPFVTVDIIMRCNDGIVLIERKNPPPGWALPGGFVDVGESLEEAAVREAKEETSLDITLVEQFHAYSNPGRDPRFHTVTMVFIADSTGTPKGLDDARRAEIFTEDTLPGRIAFDHGRILADYFTYVRTGRKPSVGADEPLFPESEDIPAPDPHQDAQRPGYRDMEHDGTVVKNK